MCHLHFQFINRQGNLTDRLHDGLVVQFHLHVGCQCLLAADSGHHTEAYYSAVSLDGNREVLTILSVICQRTAAYHRTIDELDTIGQGQHKTRIPSMVADSLL